MGVREREAVARGHQRYSFSRLQAGRTMLRVVSLLKRYPTAQGQLNVLRGVDLKLEAGTSLALMGESGSGKSTLLHLIAALDAPDSGEIMLDGQEIAGLSDAERATLRRG